MVGVAASTVIAIETPKSEARTEAMQAIIFLTVLWTLISSAQASVEKPTTKIPVYVRLRNELSDSLFETRDIWCGVCKVLCPSQKAPPVEPAFMDATVRQYLQVRTTPPPSSWSWQGRGCGADTDIHTCVPSRSHLIAPRSVRLYARPAIAA